MCVSVDRNWSGIIQEVEIVELKNDAFGTVHGMFRVLGTAIYQVDEVDCEIRLQHPAVEKQQCCKANVCEISRRS